MSVRTAFIAPVLMCLAWLPLAGHASDTQGSGKQIIETRTLPEFQAISLRGSMDLEVRQGSQQSVQVSADDNLMSKVETVVEGTGSDATLVVRWKQGQGWNWSWGTRSTIKLMVVVPRLTALAANGSGDIRLEPFSTPTLKVSLSGSGDARLNGLTTDDLGISISGSGDVGGTGTATRVKISIAGSGDVRLAEMRADEVRVSIAGSGDASVQAQKALEVSIAGSGDVSYTGNAAVKSTVAGSGSVTKR